MKNIIIGLLLITLGFIFILSPNAVTKVGVIAFAIFNIVEGLSVFTSSFKFKNISSVFKFNMIKALVNLLISALVAYFAITTPGYVVASWIIYLIAINLLLSGLSELFETRFIRKSGYTEALYFGQTGTLSILFAILMFLFPNLINSTLLLIIAIVLITSGVFIIAWVFKLNKVLKASKAAVVEAEWEEKK